MPAEITRRRTVRDRVVLDVDANGYRYQVWIVPAKGMNHEVVGYRTWLGQALPIVGDEQHAETAALRAIERMRQLVMPGEIPHGI
jgi:hypothetical protein